MAGAASPDAPRILIIANVEQLARRMDRNLWQGYEALARHEGVTLAGPGCDGFTKGMPVTALFDRFGRPDFIFHGVDLGATGSPLVSGLGSLDVPKAMQIVDSWEAPEVQQRLLRDHRFDYAFHVARLGEPDYERACPGTRFIWTPNAVCTETFRDYGLRREQDVLFYGATYDWYPLRQRLRTLLTSPAAGFLRVKIIPHPGYWDGGYAPQPDHYVGEKLAQEINRSWITVATASVHDCLFVKHLEIAAAMSLPAGSVPQRARPLFGEGFLSLADLADGQVLESLRQVLSDKKALTARIAEAYHRVRACCSMEGYAESMLRLMGRLARSHGSGPQPAGGQDERPAPQDPWMPGAFDCPA
jgi:hypothetical protein